mmetsp:Transcript_20541/g.26570  ORF Transcript_20541/g.26570 Transcript_20541/m.26570 type:complete len:337 (+) Transcript_20541:103-1113(+)|eukprot:CAMPEP_0116054638 /NCGR_PEP_ID=MMETSP0322-20121206/2922_1 /TAXON_ID=163516 /ORGANISM="Leptocylindrus danicus var. apora, Strain B651" /LENGTH=336 /DNA_ID=CAMNT_0003538071 /DNA_START=22 /DNA_END=1032 /DNA_ORIENTATION=+
MERRRRELKTRTRSQRRRSKDFHLGLPSIQEQHDGKELDLEVEASQRLQVEKLSAYNRAHRLLSLDEIVEYIPPPLSSTFGEDVGCYSDDSFADSERSPDCVTEFPNQAKTVHAIQKNCEKDGYFLAKARLKARKSNEAVFRSIKMITIPASNVGDESSSEELSEPFLLKTSDVLFDDISEASFGSNCSGGGFGDTRDSLYMHNYRLFQEKKEELMANEAEFFKQHKEKLTVDDDDDEEMLMQLSQSKSALNDNNEDEDLAYLGPIHRCLNPCFLAFVLMWLILTLVLFLVPWNTKERPARLPDMPSLIPSLQPSTSASTTKPTISETSASVSASS